MGQPPEKGNQVMIIARESPRTFREEHRGRPEGLRKPLGGDGGHTGYVTVCASAAAGSARIEDLAPAFANAGTAGVTLCGVDDHAATAGGDEHGRQQHAQHPLAALLLGGDLP